MSTLARRLAGGLLTPVVVLAASSALAQGTASPAGSTTPPSGPDPAQRIKELRSALDRDYLAGPSISDPIGYRTLWQTRIRLAPEQSLKGLDVESESTFVWDTNGVVTRLRPANGDLLWQGSTNSRLDRILSVTMVPTPKGPQAAVLTDTQCLMLDQGNGFFAGRQPFKRLANTPAILVPPFLVYGTRAGQLVWHQYLVGYDRMAAQLDGQMVASPTLAGNKVVAGTISGAVGAYTAERAEPVWQRRLNGAVVATPAADKTATWVACKDQYLWCLSMADGRTLWKYFTESPLTNSPVHLDGALYLDIPTEGLVCFDPLPADKIDGAVRWRSKNVTGQALGLCRAGLLVWSDDQHVLRVLDERNGDVVQTLNLPGTSLIRVTAPIDGDLILGGPDGRVQRLTPLARRPVSVPDAPATAATTGAPAPAPAGGTAPAPVAPGKP